MAKENLEYYIKILPSGNQGDFPLIEEQLKGRDVIFESRALKAGGRIYRIPSSEVHKLPKDEKGPYLPITEESGHSMYIDADNKDWEDFE